MRNFIEGLLRFVFFIVLAIIGTSTLNFSYVMLCVPFYLFLYEFTSGRGFWRFLLIIDLLACVGVLLVNVITLIFAPEAFGVYDNLTTCITLSIWLYFWFLTTNGDGDERGVFKSILYYIVLFGGPFIINGVLYALTPTLLTILVWVVAINFIILVILLCSLGKETFGGGSYSSYSSGYKTPSASQLRSACVSAAGSVSYVDFVGLEGSTIILAVDGNRGDVHVNNQVDAFMKRVANNLSGYDLSDIDVRYTTRYR